MPHVTPAIDGQGSEIKRAAYNSGECLLVGFGGDLGIPWWVAVQLFLFLQMAREA